MSKARTLARVGVSTAVVVALAFLCAQTALAAESKTVTRELHFVQGEAVPEPDAQITEDGVSYKLVSVTEPVVDTSATIPTQSYTRSVSKDIPLESRNNPGAHFSSSYWIEDGEFSGGIPLATNPYQIQEVWESYSGQVDRFITLEGFPDNDTSRLPTDKDFEVSSDAALGATTIKSLTLLNATYEASGYNNTGLPNEWRAHCIYRGEESWLELHHYTAVATYSGTLSSSLIRYVVVATYEEESVPTAAVAPTTRPTSTSTEVLPAAVPTADAAPNAILAWYVAAIVAVLALGTLLWYFLVFRKNAKLVRTEGEQRHTIARKHLNLTRGEAVFSIADKCELYDGANYHFELKPRLANQQGNLVVRWRDKVIAKEELRDYIALDVTGFDKDDTRVALSEGVASALNAESGV